MNGAAARLVQPGDKVIIICYGLVAEENIHKQEPKIAVLDDDNQIIEMLGAEKRVRYYSKKAISIMEIAFCASFH